MREQHACLNCGKNFISYGNKNCSLLCRREWYKKKNTRICKICGKLVIGRTFCSKECKYKQVVNTRKLHNNYKHTGVTRKKISDTLLEKELKIPENRIIQREITRRNNGWLKHPSETKKKMKDAIRKNMETLGYRNSPATIEKMRIAKSKYDPAATEKRRQTCIKKYGVDNPGKLCLWQNYVTRFGKTIRLQGSYEVRFAKILDKWQDDNIVKSWEKTRDKVSYIGLDNKNHDYFPDFKVIFYNRIMQYYDPKNNYLLSLPEVQHKIREVSKKIPLQIIKEEDLKILEGVQT